MGDPELRNKLSTAHIATFAKHMLCPYSVLHPNQNTELSEQGLKDFTKYPYRMLSDSYEADSDASEDILLDEITKSLKNVDSCKRPLLLLSDGKDSMGLALGYSHLGMKIDTLTFLRRDDSELKDYITNICNKLGHTAHFVEVDEIITSFDKSIFLSACENMNTPVLDQGFLFFLFGLRTFFDNPNFDPSDYVIIDGLGNDETFGYLPSEHQIRSFKLAKMGIWKMLPKSCHSLKWYLRSPAESHGDLSALACFFPIGSSYDLNKYFSKIEAKTQELSFIDFRAFSRGAFHDHQCMMGKTVASTKHLGADVNFPWLASSLAKYVFNLPKNKKFNFNSLTNKVLLRELLENKLGWHQQKRGVDLYFDLDLDSFKINVLDKIIPEKITKIIKSNKLLPSYVKQRAYLELLNLYGFCIAQGMASSDIEDILLK